MLFSIRDDISRELDHLEEGGIIEKVKRSSLASPIVPVPKKNGWIRICGDYKVTVNPHLEVDKHPLPKPEELFAILTRGKKFTTLELTHAYQQIPLEEQAW